MDATVSPSITTEDEETRWMTARMSSIHRHARIHLRRPPVNPSTHRPHLIQPALLPVAGGAQRAHAVVAVEDHRLLRNRSFGEAGEGTSIEKFRETYVEILEGLRDALSEVVLVLCEPTVIWPPAPAEGNKALAPYVMAVREIGEWIAANGTL